MNEIKLDFLTILLPSYLFFYMAVSLYARDKKRLLNRVASLLMLTLLFYFMGEYVKTALFPQIERELVLYWNAPMLLLTISLSVHLSVLIAGLLRPWIKRIIVLVYAVPLLLHLSLLLSNTPQELYHPKTDGTSPLHPDMLLLAVTFVSMYLFSSVAILFVAWLMAKQVRRKKVLMNLLMGWLLLFLWILFITSLLFMKVITSETSMALYFTGALLWVVNLRNLVSKYDFLPSYRDLFHNLFQSAPTAIVLLDMQGNQKEMNPRANEVFGNSAFTNTPVRVTQCLFFDEYTSLADRWDETKREAGTNWEMTLQLYNQEPRTLIVSIEVIDGADMEEGLLMLHLTDITSLKETQRRLIESESSYRYLAYHDALTGLCNRVAIQEKVSGKIAAGEPFALVLIDLDNFKPVNDTYGHLVGDQYLRHIAAKLQESAKPGDLLGRLGGDEFVLLIPHRLNEKQAHQEALERFEALSDSPFQVKQTMIPVSFSAGVSLHPEHASDITTLLQKADDAMYSVKRSGKNAISVHAGGTR
ncbi:sensor domain-containing diguanylate cyclase [Paenibacillus silvisoli]|uniref:sensor domain-containing diguanylate cyclase n=1 Tax=Paenibacillus silvisoli TaxID=3110539 RepID=UPI0028043811|nr:diguanylate cyclase [Paenibacillus silvisoli]